MQPSTDWKRLTPPLFNPNFGGVPLHQIAWALSYSAVKLLLKNSNLCDHGTWSLRMDRRTDERHAISQQRSALASCGNEMKTVHCTLRMEDCLLLVRNLGEDLKDWDILKVTTCRFQSTQSTTKHPLLLVIYYYILLLYLTITIILYFMSYIRRLSLTTLSGSL